MLVGKGGGVWEGVLQALRGEADKAEGAVPAISSFVIASCGSSFGILMVY